MQYLDISIYLSIYIYIYIQAYLYDVHIFSTVTSLGILNLTIAFSKTWNSAQGNLKKKKVKMFKSLKMIIFYGN